MRRAIIATVGIILGAFSGTPYIGVAAGAPATIISFSGTPQSTAVNTIFQVRLVAYVRDANTNGVPGLTVTFTAPGSGASATFNGAPTAKAVTDGTGVAVAPTLTANGLAGSYALTAVVTGLATPATFSLTNTGTSSSGPQVPTNLRLITGVVGSVSVSATAGTPQSAMVNTAFGTALQATVRDASSNPASGVTVIFTAPASGASASFVSGATASATTNASGVASAPAITANSMTGSYTVTASVVGATAPANFSLNNSTVASGVGVWTNVTPAGLSLDPNLGGLGNNFGSRAVVADPVKKSDLYVTVDAGQGIWKSTDYGLTWTKVSTPVTPYGALAIDPNASRNPATAPTLWLPAGYGSGVNISTNAAVSWTSHHTNNATAVAAGLGDGGNDVYQVAVDPANSQHLLATFHGYPGLSESFNGGVTWSTVTAVNGTMGVSLYAFFTNPSPSEVAGGASVSTTWLTISQWDAGQGIWRTTNSGANWTKVDSLQHLHGNAQMFMGGGGVIYAAGVGGSSGNGVYRSTDYGQSFVRVNDGTLQNGMYGTPNFVYADLGWASQGAVGQSLQRTARSDGVTWSNYMATPSGMTNGSQAAAVTYDASANKYIIVSGNRMAGIWRYVE